LSWDRDDVIAALIDLVERQLRLDPGSLSADDDLADLGVDSMHAVELAAALAERLGRAVDEGLFYEHHTIDALATALVASGRTISPLHRGDVG
jgi:acyl carrier protein